MATYELNSRAIDPDAALTLVVGWKSGSKRRLRQLTIGEDVAAAFRSVVSTTLDDLANREAVEWSPEADLNPETYLVISQTELGTAPPLTSEHNSQTLASALASAETLPNLPAGEIPTANLSFYAFVVGNSPGGRAVFLRRANPRRGLRSGRIFTFLADTLRTIEEPLFAFDEFVDLLFANGKVYILSQSVFAAIFRDQDTLAGLVPGWADDLQQHVSMTDGGRERLIDRALRDTRLKARLEAIVRRGHLATISPDAMRQAMLNTGMNPGELLDDAGRLKLEAADIPQILYFLNEDLFTGPLSNTGFRADKKAQR